MHKQSVTFVVIVVAAALVASVALPNPVAAVDTPSTSLVSRATGQLGVKGNASSFNTSMSGDGRFVVFESVATNLDPADSDGSNDIYLRDRSTGTTTLVSRATGAAGVKGNGSSFDPDISADGRRVAFHSFATNLDPANTVGSADVYVRDLVTQTTTLVSRTSGAAGSKGNAGSRFGSISGDGRMVAFVSVATNLDPADADAASDVFIRDTVANTTTLVSRTAGAAGARGNGASGGSEPVISTDGRRVAFNSVATNLDPADPDATSDVFVRDVVANTVTLASRATGGAGAKGNAPSGSLRPSLSGDGQKVVFESTATNLDPADADATRDVFVRDLAAATTVLASRATGAAGAKGNSVSGILGVGISSNGRSVAFGSNAANLDPADADFMYDVFVRDIVASTTTLVTRANRSTGTKGNSTSGFRPPSLSADGRYVAFESDATNLSPQDPDATVDVFVRDTALHVGTVADPGYWLVARDGGIFSFNATFSGSTGAIRLNQPIVGMAPDPDGKGYWFVAADGGVFAFDATFHGSMGGKSLNQPIVGMAPTVTGKGYWLVARDGGIFAFGDAVFSGSTGAIKLNRPIVGMTADLDGKGYWFVAADGGIFAFDAVFSGSAGATKLNQPMVGMAADPDGKGYWLVARDGGVFSFDATFSGSTGAIRLNQPIVGMAADPDGKGYWFVAADGGVFAFDAMFHGSTGAIKLNQPIVGMAPA